MESALKLIHNFNRIILNPIIYLMFAVALIVFVYGVFEYVRQSDSSDERAKGTQHMLWGIVGMFIMISVFGIMKLIMGSFGISGGNLNQVIPL